MEEERIVGPGVFDKPMHGSKNVLLRWLAHGVLLVVCEDDHVLPFVAKVLDKVAGHVPDIIDTTSKLPPLPKIVDANQQGFPSASTLRILESISLGSTVPEVLGCLRRRRWGLGVAVNI